MKALLLWLVLVLRWDSYFSWGHVTIRSIHCWEAELHLVELGEFRVGAFYFGQDPFEDNRPRGWVCGLVWGPEEYVWREHP